MDSLLSIVTFIPALGALVLAVFLRGDDEAANRNAKAAAMFATSATFLVSLFILFGFDVNETGFQFVEQADWLMGLQYKMGVDGISLVCDADDLHDASGDCSIMERRNPRQGVHDRVSVVGNADAGCLHGARSCAVLPVL